MIIEKNKVVSIHYTLTDDQGKPLESSRGGDPMRYLHGHKNMIPGVETALDGKAAADQIQITLSPEDAYGARDESKVQRVPLKQLGADRHKLKKGMPLKIETRNGPGMVRVVKVGRFVVDLDSNHPMAGMTLTFDISIEDIRDASEEELSHGHAHGSGGHQHD